MNAPLLKKNAPEYHTFSPVKKSHSSGSSEFTNNKPYFHQQRQLTSHISSSTVQLTKGDAEKYVQKHNIGLPDINKDTVTHYVNNIFNPQRHRIGLLNAWNNHTINFHEIARPDDLQSPKGGTITGHRLTRSDSPLTAMMDYDVTLGTLPTLSLQTQAGSQSKVPVITDSSQAIKMTRAFDSAPVRKLGPQFILQQGTHTGLFEAPRGNDMVFTPLAPVTEAQGIFLRQGGIENWTNQAKTISMEFINDSQRSAFKQDLVSTVRGGFIPEGQTAFNTAGMMMCDARTSITGFINCVDEFEKSKEISPDKCFSSNPKEKPLWEPSITGGRKIPADKKASWEEIMITADNSTITYVIGTQPTREQILTVRYSLFPDGAPIPKDPATIQTIMNLLNLRPPSPF